MNDELSGDGLVLVSASFMEDLNAGLVKGLEALRMMEAKHGRRFRLLLAFNDDGKIGVTVEPEGRKRE